MPRELPPHATGVQRFVGMDGRVRTAARRPSLSYTASGRPVAWLWRAAVPLWAFSMSHALSRMPFGCGLRCAPRPTAFDLPFSLGVATLESPLYFTFYEQTKHALARLYGCRRDQLSLASVSWTSFCSTALSALVTNPIDVLRTRVMVSSAGTTEYGDLARRIWRREGVTAFVRGAPARVLYLAPNHCLAMTAFEFISRHWAEDSAAGAAPIAPR